MMEVSIFIDLIVNVLTLKSLQVSHQHVGGHPGERKGYQDVGYHKTPVIIAQRWAAFHL